MFGNVAGNKINESTPMNPVSPYGVSKLYSYHDKYIEKPIMHFYQMEFYLTMSRPIELSILYKKITKGISNILW